jgi:UDP-glucuronate 4-epimerase
MILNGLCVKNQIKRVYLITGAAGFIGSSLCLKLANNNKVIGVDNLSKDNNYFIKIKRHQLVKKNIFKFYKLDINDENKLNLIIRNFEPDCIIHLAASAGVRDSIDNPKKFITNNILGFFNVIEAAKKNNVKKFIYASSSSVYGLNQKIPFKENLKLNFAPNIYASTKQSNEMIAKTYEYLHGYPSIGLRFFSVYGPWGRPDMAVYKFTGKILEKKNIRLYGNGKYRRDFTYIDDIVECIIRLTKIKKSKKNSIINIGGSKDYNVLDLVRTIEKILNLKAKIIFEKKTGEMKITRANTKKLEKLIGYKPKTNLEMGVNKFIKWYLDFSGYKSKQKKPNVKNFFNN